MTISLSQLVKDNNIEQIRLHLQKDKELRGYVNWNTYYCNACRDAINLGHKEILQIFLDEGMEPDAYANAENGINRSLQYFAAKVGSLDMVRLLVSKGAKGKKESMYVALSDKNIELIRYLLENGVTSCSESLAEFAFEGHREIVELLADHGASISNALRLNWESFLRKTRGLSLVKQYSDSVQIFLDEGLDANAEAHENGTYSPLHPLKYFAAKVGNLEMVQLLVERCAKIVDNRPIASSDQQEAMHGAIETSQAHVVQYLLDHNGNAEGMLDTQTFLGSAASDSQKCIVELLVKHGASVKKALLLNDQRFRQQDQSFKTALFWFNDTMRVSRAKYSSELEMQNWEKEGQVLNEKHQRFLDQHTQSIKLLMNHATSTNLENLDFLKGIDITGFNFFGVHLKGVLLTKTMLMEFRGYENALYGDTVQNFLTLGDAAKMRLEEVVKACLAKTDNPNIFTTDSEGSCSAVEAAAAKGYYAIVQLLVEHPKFDKTFIKPAKRAAKLNGHLDLVKYLNALED